ncbi:hypothetical protein [Legionella bozemanae]|uniref:hypothetical protein n=1 Tax=Legionella bozemanae TaxID=447 RepID=UPI00399D3268
MTPAQQILSQLKENKKRMLLNPEITVKKFGVSLLHHAADNPELLQHHLQTLTPSEQYAIVKKKTKMAVLFYIVPPQTHCH